jgi:hypothetical protein
VSLVSQLDGFPMVNQSVAAMTIMASKSLIENVSQPGCGV